MTIAATVFKQQRYATVMYLPQTIAFVRIEFDTERNSEHDRRRILEFVIGK